MTGECFRCGAPGTEAFGNGYLCEECIPPTDEDVTSPDESPPENLSDGIDNETETQEGEGARTPEDGVDAGTSDDNNCNREGCIWRDADFSDPTPGVWPSELLDREQWMGHVSKKPFAPWGDRNAPAECNNDECPADRADDPECDCDARRKWGYRGHYVDGDTVALAEDDHRLDGRAFLQQEDDPYAFVDGDDVRCPETGAVHPAFIDALEQLGYTYADVSTSGAGVHAYFRGDLPDGVKQAAWELDTESWGANDDLPSIEIYAGKHVCAATGEHVPGTPTEIQEWDADALEALLDEQGQLPDSRPDVEVARERVDLENYEPQSTTSSETTDDIRDVFAALDRLDARRVADRTIVGGWNDDASTSSGKRAFIPTWGSSSDNGTANVVDDQIWQDTGSRGGYGGPVVMALIHAGELSDRGVAPSDARGALWWQGVEHLRDLGFDIPEYVDDGDDVEHVAVLPNTPREHARTNVWDWKAAGSRAADDADSDPLQAARDRTQDVLEGAIGGYEQHALVEALPTLGKSSSTIRAAAATDEPVTILTGRGHKEQYEQFQEWADDHGLRSAVLPSFTHDCPTACGDHGDEWRDRVMGWYRRGATAQEIHKYAEQELGRPLPCQTAEDGRAIDCELSIAWQAVDYDETDVLIGHYAHAHKPEVTQGRTVVFDEFPGAVYETELGDRLQGAVTQFLQRHDELPFVDYTDLLEHRRDDDARAQALTWFLSDDADALARDPEEVFAGDSGHAIAPLATFALLAGDDLGNGLEHTDFAGTGDGLGNAAAVYDREQGAVGVLTPPALERSRGVVALDGTPTLRMWRSAIGDRALHHRPVLTEDERREYIRDGLGIQFVRTTEFIKPYTPTAKDRSKRINTEEDAALLEAIRDRHGEKPGLITTTAALAEYNADDDVDIEWSPEDGLGDSSLVDAAGYRGNVLGSNEFSEKRVGAIIGSTHYGDGFIKKWAAYDGEAAEPNRDPETGEGFGADLSYGAVGDEILAHTREHQTLQAAMRFGRDGGGATVYVHTDTLPDWVPVAGEGRVVTTWSDGLRQVVDALRDLDYATTADVADHPDVEIKLRQVFDHLETLRGYGVLKRRQDGDDGRRVEWVNANIDRLNEHGEVELDDVDFSDLASSEVDALARTTHYTWECMNFAGTDDAGGGGSGAGEFATDGGVSIGGEPPPDDAE